MSRVSHVASFTLTPTMAKLHSMSIHGANPLHGEATKHVNTWRPSFLAHDSSFSCGIFHPDPRNGEAPKHVKNCLEAASYERGFAAVASSPTLPSFPVGPPTSRLFLRLASFVAKP